MYKRIHMFLQLCGKLYGKTYKRQRMSQELSKIWYDTCITEDREGVQIRTQWDTGIKSCQKAVQINNIFHFISYWFYCFAYNKIKDIYYA